MSQARLIVASRRLFLRNGGTAVLSGAAVALLAGREALIPRVETELLGWGALEALQAMAADGEDVVDVPPKLSARTRVFATGQGRKTDATDAHSVALVGTRMTGLRPVVNDE